MTKADKTNSKAPSDVPKAKLPIVIEETAEGSLTATLNSITDFKAMFGVQRLESANGLVNTLLTSLGSGNDVYRELAISLMTEFGPRDPMEGMLISQLSATHIAISCFSQRMLTATNPDLREGYERSLTRLQRTFIAQMAALKKYRELPQHRAQVGHVTVNDGGQAIVGNVQS